MERDKDKDKNFLPLASFTTEYDPRRLSTSKI